jgi:phosphatidate cytidylyltransferase
VNKVVVRVLVFLVGLPLVLGLSIWDWASYLPLALAAALVSALGAGEMATLLRSQGYELNQILPFVVGALFPLLGYGENLGVIRPEHTRSVIALVIIAVFIRQIFANTEENLKPVLHKVTGNLFTLMYPGFFIYFIVKIHSFPEAWVLMPVFLLATIGNDALAWLFGSLWGRNSSKPFLVSPHKSVIGFVGGILATFIVLVAAYFWFPGLLGSSLWPVLVLALVLALTTIVGDLFESSLKRSARVKDSGTLVPGRGGVLDSVDSLLFSAPVFYLFLLYGRV